MRKKQDKRWPLLLSSYPLLSEALLRDPRLVQYNTKFLSHQVKETGNLTKVTKKVQPKVRKIIDRHNDVFRPGIGKATGRQITIMMNDTVTPVVQKPRDTSYNLAAKVEAKITYLLNQDIIEKVLDKKYALGSVQQFLHQNPISIRYVYAWIWGWQTRLFSAHTHNYPQWKTWSTPKSHKITTFYGPDKLYRYKRLNYGTKSAWDILQNEMRSILLSGIPNQINITDDILMAGSIKKHNKALELVLNKTTRQWNERQHPERSVWHWRNTLPGVDF